ncbi:AI-2E family transporter [Thermococcus sp. P6]|uniref:AI-2E family transporter n=1 Tax=Thermococcus sp. P6 TaxID=122420 RepID=UPI000B59E7D4|nr:AI-2E family transporter [Thermococcus sp. P6]ASJ09871.1 AI-2E family transporter [Thermococcus sp. P6]
MRVEGFVWLSIVVLILYLAWGTVSPLITPIFFGLILAYAVHPLHRLLRSRAGKRASAVILTLGMIGLGGVLTLGLFTVTYRVAFSLYRNVEVFFDWLMALPLPGDLLEFVQNFSDQLIPRLSEYVSEWSLSIPAYLLQLVVFLFTFYYALVFSEEIVAEIRSLIPEENRRLGEELLESLNKTLGALVRAWLVLNILKGFLMTLGFLIFGVSDLYTAIVAGFLTFVFSFVPLFEGWMIWLAAGIYFASKGMYFHAAGISLYGFLLVSPMPDYTIRPMMVARDTDLDETLVFLGMVGGTWAMGVKGLIIGPIALNLLLVILKEWKRVVAKESSRQPAQAPSGPSPRPVA